VGAKTDLVRWNLGDVDLRKLAESLAQLAQARLHELLPLEGSFVFAVLAQVTQFHGSANLLRQDDVQLVLKTLYLASQFCLEHLDHAANALPDGDRGRFTRRKIERPAVYRPGAALSN
jgi:hypothetical protein